MTLKTLEAIKFAEKIQKDILDGKMSTLNILRQYYSLAILLDKKDDIEWALNELDGYKYIKKIPSYRKVRHRGDNNKFAVIPHGCGIIEEMFQSGAIYRFNCVKLEQSGLPTKNVSPFVDYLYSTVNVEPSNFRYVLDTLTNLIYKKTQQILLEIKFGKFEFDIFEETRKVVDAELSKRYPKVFEKLTEAYEDLMKGESTLDLQQVALACRVVIKNFADAIYPPSNKTIIGSDNKPHSLKDDDYINRIIAHIQESTDSKSNKEIIRHSLVYLGNFLKSINDLANIGTHNEKPKEDANRCLIYTYLILGDVIKLLRDVQNQEK